jgi:predicted acyltransferase (DUF342 family)
MPPSPNTSNHDIAQANAAKREKLLESSKKQYLREHADESKGALKLGAMSTPLVGAAAGVPAANAPAPTVAVVSKTGIVVTYDDSTTQQISFTQNTLSLDSGLNVYNGITYLADGLDVDGDAHLYNDLTLEGSAALNNAVTITHATGDALTVNGDSHLDGSLQVDSALNVNGATELRNAVTVLGATQLNSTLTVGGTAAINNNVTITQPVGTAFTVAGSTSLNGNVHMLQNLTLDGTLTMSSGMNIARDPADGYALTMNGTSAFNDSVTITRAVADGDALTVVGLSKFEEAALFESSLTVEDTTALNNSVTITRPVADGYALTVAGKIHGIEDVVLEKNLTVNGNLIVTGSQTTIESTNTVFVDNVVTYAKNNPADLVAAGLNIEYKPSGSTDPQYAGLKRLPTSGEFVFFKNATQPIANTPATASQAEIDAANQTVLDAQADYNDALADKNTADALVATRLQEKNTAEAAKLPPFDPSVIPANERGENIPGEWIQLDLGTSGAQHNQFNLQWSGWTQPRKIRFLGSNDGVTFTDLGESTGTGNGSGPWYYTSSTHRYIRMIIRDIYTYWSGDSNQEFIWYLTYIGNGGASLIDGSWRYDMSRISKSSGLANGHWWGNLDAIGFIHGGRYTVGGYNTVGTYIGSQSNIVEGPYTNHPLYLQYLVDAQPLINAYNAAVTAYNIAVSDAAVKASIATYYYNNIATTQAEADATIAAAQAAAQLASASNGVYAVVMAESFNCASDARLKNNIVNLDGALDKLDSIRGVYHHWNNEAQPNRAIGVIAQEVQAVYPELVIEGGNGFLSVDYPKLTAVLLQSIKELKAMVLELAAKK